ncbi:MAG: ABC transporter permease [Mycoplasma sp.]|nr:ABC transporter permease [Mycoplasma sp.]
MFSYIIKRLLLTIVSLIALIIITYFLMGLLKGNPLDPSKYKTTAEYDKAVHDFGLDKSVAAQFASWFAGLFRGDLGPIYNPAAAGVNKIQDLFFGPLKYTLLITSSAFILSTIIGVTLGIIAGYNNGKSWDIIINIFVIFFLAIPTFILAAFLLVIGPYMGLPAGFLDWAAYGWGLSIRSMVLPVIALTVTQIAVLTYYVRNEVITVLASEYIVNAQSKGLSTMQVFRKYVWRNLLVPIVTIVIPSFVALLAGSLIVEQFFAIPGSSTVITNAVRNKETNIVMFNVIFFGALAMLSQLIVDVSYVFIDPRIKYSSASEVKSIGIKAWYKRKRNKNVNANMKGVENA